MTKRSLLKCLLCVLAALPAAASTTFDHRSGGGIPRTVTEFYLALPESMSEIAGMDRSDPLYFESGFIFGSRSHRSVAARNKYLRSLIRVEDIRNGYLKLKGPWEGWAEVALFRNADRSYIVCVSQVGCGPSCEGEIIFLTLDNRRWTNVTASVFPFDPNSAIGYFKLPRTGARIDLICGDESDETCKLGTRLRSYRWDRKTFMG